MLNDAQAQAVEYIGGPLLVLAGAGSGKTRVIIQKIAYLLKTCEYNPQTVFAVTFTNKAANEMRTRINDSIPKAQRRGLTIATFHTLGLKIIKKHLDLCGLRENFTIFDQEDVHQILKDLLPKAVAQSRDDVFRIGQYISNWKNALKLPEDLKTTAMTEPLMHEAANIYASFTERLKTYNAVDFDDLVLLPVKLLSQHDSVRDYWQNRVRHLLVDEYQDSNISQYQFVQLLVGMRAALTVVGDDFQSIYAWRGARPENIAKKLKNQGLKLNQEI